jgi:hypothetical protein
MEGVLSYQFSLSDLLNGLIAGSVLWFIGYLLRRLRRSYLLLLPRQKQNNFIQLWRRIKSDEFHAARQVMQVEGAVSIFGSMTVILLIYSARDGLGKGVAAALLIAMLLLFFASVATDSWNRALNQKATEFRMRLERRRKSSRTRQQPVAGDVGAGAGARGEPIHNPDPQSPPGAPRSA